MITISKLATSAALEAPTRGKGACGSPGKGQRPHGTEGAGSRSAFRPLGPRVGPPGAAVAGVARRGHLRLGRCGCLGAAPHPGLGSQPPR